MIIVLIIITITLIIHKPTTAFKYSPAVPILDVFNGEEIFAITENNEIIHDIFGQIIFDRAMSYTNFNIQNVYSDNFFAILDDSNNKYFYTVIL